MMMSNDDDDGDGWKHNIITILYVDLTSLRRLMDTQHVKSGKKIKLNVCLEPKKRWRDDESRASPKGIVAKGNIIVIEHDLIICKNTENHAAKSAERCKVKPR